MELIFKLLQLFAITLYAHTDIQVFNGNPVYLHWQEYGEEYEHMVEIYMLRDREESLIYSSEWIFENGILVAIEEESSYLWKVYIRESGKECDDEHQCFNVESGYFDFYKGPGIAPNDPVENPPEEIVDKPLEKIEETVPSKKPQKVKSVVKKQEVLGVSKKSEKREETVKEEKENEKREKKSKPVEENICTYTYNIERNNFTLKECNIPKPKTTSATYYTYKDSNIVNIKGSYEDRLKITVENTVCKDFDLLNSKTWFGCDEIVTGSNEYYTNLDYEVYFFADRVIPPTNFIFGKTNFEIGGILDKLPKEVVYKAYFSLKHREQWLDQKLSIKLPIVLNRVENGSSGIYDFPFSRIVNVNQWHGCTQYQCPHTGIDFAVAKEKIYASGNGVVLAKGYDNYFGECNSGGNYLLLKYNGGHHMSYMHLEKSFVKKGQKIKKGDLIALSGNSGSYNCQPLGYNLHFELREGRKQNTHTNPVPHIGVDWRLVKTNMANRYPKRLSGDNPHPNY